MRVLISYGGTEEPIDGVRYITNFSTGKTGATISNYFFKNGVDITVLKAKRAKSPDKNIAFIEFTSFNDLNSKMEKLLGSNNFDAVIHLAAVSDFSIDYLESDGKRITETDKKLNSSKPLTIRLITNFKILNRIKDYSNNKIKLIGFKLTKDKKSDEIERVVKGMFDRGNIDYVVHNDLSEINEKSHIASIFDKEGILYLTKTKLELARKLYKIIIVEKK